MTNTSRQCGTCSLCCKLLRIQELEKPKDEWCPNFATGTGCAIYADRPSSCRSFSCLWLTDFAMGPEWKPSISKMVLDSKPNLLIVHVDPAANKPWRMEPYHSVLRRLAAEGQKNRSVVLIVDRRRNIILLPDREVDLGYINADARLMIEQVPTDKGPEWRVRVMAAGEQQPPKSP